MRDKAFISASIWKNKQNLKIILILPTAIEMASNFGHCTDVRFASFLSGGFITTIVVNSPERKLAKCTSVHCSRKSKIFCSGRRPLAFGPTLNYLWRLYRNISTFHKSTSSTLFAIATRHMEKKHTQRLRVKVCLVQGLPRIIETMFF